jgi:hypothetical protein
MTPSTKLKMPHRAKGSEHQLIQPKQVLTVGGTPKNEKPDNDKDVGGTMKNAVPKRI